ncbi:MAG: IS30 family transposase [Actinomycetota bacterium]|nr:IS30 family transposase [Actinomycetota bacterium]
MAEGLELREIAARIGRNPSVVSREVRRHGGSQAYRAQLAEQRAGRSRARPKVHKVDRVPGLRALVAGLLRRGWSPASIAGRLPIDHGQDHALRMSHEAIYTWVYAQPVGALARELIALRTGRTRRTTRGGGVRRAPRIRAPRWIEERPAEAEGRAVPGHWEGDLVIGAQQASAVATLVERTSRFLMLVPLGGRNSLTVSEAIVAAVGDLPAPLKRSLTWDCGAEMARHDTVTAHQLPVFFAHPHSPWQRGSNENANRVLREYFPKGTPITSDGDYLAAVAAEINDRPRKILGWKKPSEVFAEHLASSATTG